MPVKWKFGLALTLALLWSALSVALALPWYRDLAQATWAWLAFYLIAFIAIVPGFINTLLAAALWLDHRPELRADISYPDVTILLAAYNEATSITETLQSIWAQDYPAKVHVIAINDGSSDGTLACLERMATDHDLLQVVNLALNQGKSSALNCGLAECTTEHVITLDADCYLWKNAIAHLVGRMLSDPEGTKAVAGEILIRNSRQNWITSAQEWDYFLGIAAIKRVQSLFQGTLVAQGAFSIYERKTLLALGGWPHSIGEDIVLTWRLLREGYRVGHAENACVFTQCPDSLRKFALQRLRWSRGMIEAFKQNPQLLLKPRLSLICIWTNALFPLMDLAYTLGFIPGLALALAGHYWIVGPMTLSLLPMTVLLNFSMYRRGRDMFDTQGLHVRRNASGLLFYSLVYCLVLQPVSLWGYASEAMNLRKAWGTK